LADKPLQTGPRPAPEDLWGEGPGQLWRTVIDTVTDGFLVVDAQGVIRSVNRALEQLTGYTREELVGQPCTILQCQTCLDSEGVNRNKECELFRQGEIRRGKSAIIKKDGTILPVLKNATVLKEGDRVAGVENFTDLSDAEAREEVISRLLSQLSRGERPGSPSAKFPEMMQQFIGGLHRELEKDAGFHGIIGKSPVMMQLFTLMASAAQSGAPVLIYGEAGTGKELVAAGIHRLSPRPRGPFVRVHGDGLQESHWARELFGHVPGAGAGSEPSRVGGLEAADSGAIFLDEVGDLPESIQARLLKVLREKVIEREGDPSPIPVNVRLISATKRDLRGLMAGGRFREDLYRRLGVIPIYLPPLRERREDIPLLIRTFVDRVRRCRGKHLEGISDAALNLLRRHDWPGNVRELIQVIDYACGRCPGGAIQPEHLPAAFQAQSAPSPRGTRGGRGADERWRLIQAINQARGKKTEAALLLGISRVTLWKLLKIHNIQVEKTIRS
jgi:two-component system response regulator HydG